MSETLKEQGIWSRKYKQCEDCGKTEKPHRQKGLCTSCQSKKRYKKDKEMYKKYHKSYYDDNKEELKSKMRKYYHDKNKKKEEVNSNN